MRDTVLVLNCLAKVNFYRGDKQVMHYCNKQALKVAVAYDLISEIAETYANCILGKAFAIYLRSNSIHIHLTISNRSYLWKKSYQGC